MTQDKNAQKGLIILCIAAFLVPFMGSAINLALPDISKEFGMKAVTLTWMTTAYLISTAIFQIPFARVADIIGRKKVFLMGVGMFSLCTFLSGLAPSGTVLLALRFLSGIGSAMMFGTNIAILTALFPGASRAKALGINSAVVYAALAMGPFLGGIMTQYLGWRSIFFITSGIGILILVLSKFMLKGEWLEARGEKFDIIGSILFAIAIAGIIYGFSTIQQYSGVICLFIGIIALTGFIFYEKNQKSPVFNVRLFSGNKTFTLSSLAALINYSATMGITFMLSLYLQYVRGLNATEAGLILISQACIQSVFSLVAGNLSARIAPSRLATFGMSLVAAGLCGLIFLSATTPYWIIVIWLLLLGIGFGIFSSPNTNVIMSSVDKKYYTQASATTGTMRLTGQAFSMGIASMMISFFVGNNSITPELHTEFLRSMQMTFTVFVILCLFGVYASAARNKKNDLKSGLF